MEVQKISDRSQNFAGETPARSPQRMRFAEEY